jgi:hypothetical protein
VHVLAAGFDGQVGNLAIERMTYGEQFLQFAQGIAGLQQRTVLVVAGAHIQFVRLAAQVDDGAAALEVLAVVRAQYRAAAGGQHDARPLAQFIDHRRLTPAEAFLALQFEDGRNGHAATLDDGVVGIDELHLPALGQQLADGGLAGTHEADEKDAGGGNHGRILFDAGSFRPARFKDFSGVG